VKKKTGKTIARLTNDAAVILQRIVRMKASEDGYCTCVTCGKVCHWQECDGGHFISRTHTVHKLLEENIHPQCKGCNGFKGGAYKEYTLFMIDTYGRACVDNLLQTKTEVRKYSRVEILGIIEDLKHYESEIRGIKGL
jgi:hypothetical protein